MWMHKSLPRLSRSPNLRSLLCILAEKMVHTRISHSRSLFQGHRSYKAKIMLMHNYSINDHAHQIWEGCYLHFQRNDLEKDNDMIFAFKVTGPKSRSQKICSFTTTLLDDHSQQIWESFYIYSFREIGQTSIAGRNDWTIKGLTKQTFN